MCCFIPYFVLSFHFFFFTNMAPIHNGTQDGTTPLRMAINYLGNTHKITTYLRGLDAEDAGEADIDDDVTAIDDGMVAEDDGVDFGEIDKDDHDESDYDSNNSNNNNNEVTEDDYEEL